MRRSIPKSRNHKDYAMPRPLYDSEYIFGLHDPGGEQIMLDAGRPGWLVFPEAIGHDPNDFSGKNFTQWSNRNLGIICRLNNGFGSSGTIPHSSQYEQFAKRCANYVRASAGCKIWIIGNEMNYEVERPRASAARAVSFGTPFPQDAPDAAADPQTGPRDGSAAPSFWERVQRWLGQVWSGSETNSASSSAEAGADAPPPDAGSTQPAPTKPAPTEPDPSFAPAPDASSDVPVPQGAPVGPTEDPLEHGARERFSAIHLTGARAAAASTQEVITPDLYVRCYRLCRDAIRSVPGHENDQVLIGAVAPWNDQTKYAENPTGDWVLYFQHILEKLGPNGCDGIAIHTYTHAADPSLITSEVKMNPPFQNRRFEFRTYRDFMNAIPGNMRHLPVYITEADQDVPWVDQNTGWVQRAYAEIDSWNKGAGNQQIRALVLYRWPNYDKWYIVGKNGVINDFRAAMQSDYRWSASSSPGSPETPLPLKNGDTVRTLDAVNLRRTPGYQNKPASDTIATLDAGQTATVVSGTPQSADGLIWWNVRTSGGSQTGWLAQSAPNGVKLMEKVASGGTNGGGSGGSNGGENGSGIAVGGQARTTTQVRLRRSPGYQNKPASDTISTIPADRTVSVLQGPSAADGLTWWRVRTTDINNATVEGWMAETAPNGVVLMEATESRGEAPAPGGTFAPGDSARTITVVKMRRTPGYQNKSANDVIADVPANSTVTIRSGPQQADGLTWWQVTAPVNNGTANGWMAETAPNGVTLLEKVASSAPIPEPPTPEPPAPEPPAPEPTIQVGRSVRTLEAVRLRRTPGYFDKADSDTVSILPSGTVATISSGPVQEDGLTWWLVDTRVNNQPLRGWLAQTTPAGAALIALTDTSFTPPNNGAFAPGDLIVTQSDVWVRQTPGTSNKPDSDKMGAFRNRTTLNVIEGPRSADGLTWWRVGGITTTGEAVGWSAESVGETQLLGQPAKLPGTDIPNRANNAFLNPPTAQPFGISQLWGENPDFYKQFKYNGVPLLGHNGIDFLTPTGTPLFAVDAGSVIVAGQDSAGFGNYVMLQHPWGQSIYAHMDRVDVSSGQAVSRGMSLGTSGNTGASSGPHLHFAIRINPFNPGDGWGGFSDPLPYLPPEFVILPSWVLPSPASAMAQFSVESASRSATETRMKPSPVTVELHK